MKKGALIGLISGGIIGAASIGGAVAFGILYSPSSNKNPSLDDESKTLNGKISIPTANEVIKNLPQTIAELKTKYHGYYASLKNNLKGKALFNALNLIQKPHIAHIGSYDDLWATYSKAFKDQYDEKDGTMYDIYSEKIGSKDDFNFNMPSDQDHGYHKKPGDTYNREHLIPQSIFGKNALHIHNDAHFVYPTDSAINQWRSNYVHDEVPSPTQTGKTDGGNNWKLGVGKNTNGAEAFEPDNHFKGDVARAYLYFNLSYHNYSGISGKGLSDYPVFSPSSYPYIKIPYLQEYINWSIKDPIDSFDVNANNVVAKIQGGIRNPFIDMPKLINLIYGEQN